MVCPHKAANLVAVFEAILDVTAHLSVFPMLLHIPELSSGYLEPEPWGLHASLSDAYRQEKLALHIFEGGLALKTGLCLC